MAEAVEGARTNDVPIDDAIAESARREGRRLGDSARQRLGRRSGRAARRGAVVEELRRSGFEPETLDTGVTVLHNCPFHLLAEQYTELICGMNLCLVDGLLGEVEGTELSARLEPHDEACCVRLYPDGTESGQGHPTPDAD